MADLEVPVTDSDFEEDVFVEETDTSKEVSHTHITRKSYIASVAIDFGTTYSGYAFSFNADYKRDPLAISSYPWIAPGGHLSLKTPTSLLLSRDKSFLAFGYEAEQQYADLTIDDEHHEHFFFKTFKMQLYNSKIGCDVIEDINGKPLPSVTVFAESISFLKNHFWKKLQSLGHDCIKDEDIRWVLTVPAIWDDFAKRLMRQAAVKAGILDENLILALEPEAASLYCQHLFTRKDQEQLEATEVGTKFMVLDLGGGTADITVQEKLQNCKLREIHRATGGPFGGSAVNDAFIILLEKIVGSDVIGKFKMSHLYDFMDLLGSFEVAKRSVVTKSNTTKKIHLRMPVSFLEIVKQERKTTFAEILQNETTFKNIISLKRDKLCIDQEIIIQVFMQITTEICNHVSQILASPEGMDISLIKMVGGFSESDLVKEIIRENFQTKYRRIFVPQEAGIAVLKGAVIFGHSPTSIDSRIIRYTYGNAVKVPFQDGVHDEGKRWDDGKAVWCKNIFRPFMKAGTSVKIGHTFVKRIPTSHYDSARMKIYVTNNENTKYITDDGCQELCNVLLNDVLPADITLRHKVIQTIVFGGTELNIEIKNKRTRQSHRMSVRMRKADQHQS